MEPLDVLPPVSVEVVPALLVVRPGPPRTVTVGVRVTSHATSPVSASVSLQVPSGWTARPASAEVPLGADEVGHVQQFEVSVPALQAGEWRLEASARVAGRRYDASYHAIRHRDLPVRYAVSDAAGRVAAIDVAVANGVRVGYVMGVGDELPSALAQLGAQVTLLGPSDLQSGQSGRLRHDRHRHAGLCGQGRPAQRRTGACWTGSGPAATWSCCTTRRSSIPGGSRRSRPGCQRMPRRCRKSGRR